MGAYDKKDFESQIKIEETPFTVLPGIEAMNIFNKKENKQVIKGYNIKLDKQPEQVTSVNLDNLGISKKKVSEEDKQKASLGKILSQLKAKPIEEGKAYLVSLSETKIENLSIVGNYIGKQIKLSPIGFTTKYELCLKTDLKTEPMIAGNCRSYKVDDIWYIFISIERFKKNEPIKFLLNDEEYLFGFRELSEYIENVYPYTVKVVPLLFMKI